MNLSRCFPLSFAFLAALTSAGCLETGESPSGSSASSGSGGHGSSSGAGGHTGGPASGASGHLTYRDASTKADGSPNPPSSPTPGDDLRVDIYLEGQGQLPNAGALMSCPVAAEGFSGLLTNTTTADANGGYVSAASYTDALASGAFKAKVSGCALPNLSVAAFTKVVVRGYLKATTPNCNAYCAASARADCEASCNSQCSASSNQVSCESSCRSSCEVNASATCQAQCTGGTTRSIKAETSFDATSDLIVKMNAHAVAGSIASFGSLDVDLRFDQVSQEGF